MESRHATPVRNKENFSFGFVRASRVRLKRSNQTSKSREESRSPVVKSFAMAARILRAAIIRSRNVTKIRDNELSADCSKRRTRVTICIAATCHYESSTILYPPKAARYRFYYRARIFQLSTDRERESHSFRNDEILSQLARLSLEPDFRIVEHLRVPFDLLFAHSSRFQSRSLGKFITMS